MLDIGYRTSDYAFVVPDESLGHMTPSEAYCGSINVGASAAVENARKIIERESHRRLSDVLVEEALHAFNGQMTVAGRHFDVMELVAQGARETAVQCISALERVWDDRFEACRLVVSGGGGLQVWQHIRTMHPNCTLASDPVFANAKGFFRTMHSLARV